MIKLKSFLFLVLGVVFITSCGVKKAQLSASDIKAMTTKQYDEGFDDVYKSALSLLQSEQFSIEQTDINTGLIIATKNVYTKKRSSLMKTVVIVDKLNNSLSEVKVTTYAGNEKKKGNGYRVKVQKVEGMIEDAEFYNEWFNKLQVEIARRKALY